MLSLLAAPRAAGAQQAGRLRRIGYLDLGSEFRNKPYLDALRQGLRDLGWVEGQSIAIEARFADGKTDRLPTLAAELVHRKMDVIATCHTAAAIAAKRATTTIPIVIGFAADPVRSGIVVSLARPGGNITGWTNLGLELTEKYLELPKEAVPQATRFGVFWNPANPVHEPLLKVMEAAAPRLKVELHLARVQDAQDLEKAFSALVAKRVQAIVVFPDGLFLAQTSLIVALATRSRLPSIYGVREPAEAGGLMAYGTNVSGMFRRVGASFIDKILRGASPADLPVAQPTEYELVINMKTAKTLGLTIPPSLLLQANLVLE
jgi:putative ABC transport system substrate-binding protein